MAQDVKHLHSGEWFEIFAGGGLAALIIFSVGLFLLVVPVIGWVVGPALMITAALVLVVHLFWLATKKPD